MLRLGICRPAEVVGEVRRRYTLKTLVNEKGGLIVDPLLYFEPVQLAEERVDEVIPPRGKHQPGGGVNHNISTTSTDSSLQECACMHVCMYAGLHSLGCKKIPPLSRIPEAFFPGHHRRQDNGLLYCSSDQSLYCTLALLNLLYRCKTRTAITQACQVQYK